MKSTKLRNALYLAGTILLASALVSQFKEAKLIWSSLMVIGSVLAIIWGLREDKKLYQCNGKSTNSKSKVLGVGICFALVLFGLGYSIGKLTYLWLH